MQSKLLSKKVLSSILALGALTVSSTALANSGGYEDGNRYVGLYPDGSNVVINENITDIVVYGSRVFEGTASNNTVTVSADCKGIAGASVGTGDAAGNNVIINNGTTGIVYGGRVEAGNAIGNNITINGGDVYSAVGASVDDGITEGNSVTVNNGIVTVAIGAYLDEGAAKSNNVVINGGEVSTAIGAYIAEGDALNNYVEINGVEIFSAGGASVDKGNAEGNSVVINANTKISRVAGAIVDEGNAVNNYVEINGGEINNSYIYGAKVETGNAEGNAIVINNGDITGRIYAAKVENGDAINNVLIINDGTINADNGVTNGTFVHEGNACNNAVVINGGEIHSSLDGGIVMTFGNSTGNSVVINDGKIFSYSITGGYANNGNAENNNVTINGGVITNTQSIKGGVVLQGDTTGNSVVINDGKIVNEQDERTEIYGTSVTKGNAEGNAVIINGGEISYTEIVGANIITGDALNNYVEINSGKIEYSPVYGAKVENGNAEGNMVVINDGSTGDGVRGALITGKGNAEENTVIINGGSISGAVYGAAIESYLEGKVSGNGVILNGGSVENGSIYGAMTGNGTAEGNYVVINTVQPNLYLNVYGGYTEKGDALNNSVVINGGKITGTVYGGYTNNGKAEGNVITISGDADLSGATIIAGFENANSNKLLLSDNTAGENIIRINGWSGSIAGISGTDVIEINGSKLADNGILHITGGGKTDLSGTTVKVNSIAGGQNLTTGSELEIITAEDNVDLTGIKTEVTEDGILAGVTGVASGEITTDADGNVIFKVSDVQLQKQTAITTETRAAAAAMVNQGSEVITDSISKLQYEDAGVSTFATISGNNSKYKTGSYVDINGWNGIVGAAKTVEAGSGKLSYGAFFENGSGNYNTYNDFNGNVLRGDGNAVYNGGGLLMRYAKENGVYTEASVRAGLAKNEVSNALAETSGKTHGFKTENAYYGAHVGIGKLIKLEKGKSWDIYGKYFYTHHEGDSVTIANDNFDFDAIDSSKLRLGARFSEQQGDKLTSYYGLAWEYEFSGDVGGTAAGHRMYTPSLEGSTVIGEVGFRYTPGKASPWYFDANVKGYAGMQQGISGSVQAVYSF